MLSTYATEERHTAENLAKDMKEVEANWGLDSLLFPPVYVHDNASNATKAPKIMQPLRNGIGCLAHTINLAECAATSLPEVTQLLNKSRKLVGTFKRSTIAANCLKKKQELLAPEKEYKLIQDLFF